MGGFEPECVWRRESDRHHHRARNTETGGTDAPSPAEPHGAGRTWCTIRFLAQGSTLIAAEDTGRTCYGLELSPAYVDVIVQRWQKLTGRKAVLEEDGRSFEEHGTGAGGSVTEVVDAAA